MPMVEPRKHNHKVFFRGQQWVPKDYFVNVIADSYDRMCAILLENFYFLRYRKFSVVEREDGTYVCDDAYYQYLQPDCDLVVLVAGEDNQLSNRPPYLQTINIATDDSYIYSYFYSCSGLRKSARVCKRYRENFQYPFWISSPS